MAEQIDNYFEEEFKASGSVNPKIEDTKNPDYKGSRSLTHKWKGLEFSQWGKEPADTGFDRDALVNIGKASVEIPSDIKPHQRLQRMHIANRLKGIEDNHIDWATAEAMAWGSLVVEGYNVRAVGEDTERGTFS